MIKFVAWKEGQFYNRYPYKECAEYHNAGTTVIYCYLILLIHFIVTVMTLHPIEKLIAVVAPPGGM